RICGDKILTTAALARDGLPVPKTVVTFTRESDLEAIEAMGYPVVLKPMVGSWGRLLAKINDRDAAEAVLEHKETLGSYQHGIFYIQEYVNKPQRDIRAIVVGNQTIGAIYRSSDHWITNTARNGTASVCEVTPEIDELSQKAAAAVGGGFLSVDLLEHPDGLLVNELNYTPEFHGFMAATGIPVVAHVIGLESSGGAPRTQRGRSRERTAKSGGTTRERPLVPVDEGFLFFGGAMTIRAFKIIESTLREGEQFAPAHFTPSQKIAIADLLDEFGVEYLELTSPCASPQSEADLRTIAALPLRAKVLTHVRCHLDDARIAAGTGADGIDVLFGTSSAMRTFSHGKSVDEIIETGTQVVNYIQAQGLEVRFSSED